MLLTTKVLESEFEGRKQSEVGFIALYGIAVETGVVMVIYLHEALDKKLKAVPARSRISTTQPSRGRCSACGPS